MKITDLKANEVIHCKTKEEAVRICGMMHVAGLAWVDGEEYSPRSTYWYKYEGDSCYCPKEGCVGTYEYFTKKGYTIHPSELFQSDEITEAGLLARGFEWTDNRWVYPSIHFVIEVSEKLGVSLRTDNSWSTLPAVKTLSDIDHLIRLLGV